MLFSIIMILNPRNPYHHESAADGDQEMVMARMEQVFRSDDACLSVRPSVHHLQKYFAFVS